MAPVECRIWMRRRNKNPSEARVTSARPAFFRLIRIGGDASLSFRSSATGDKFCIKIALCRFGLDPLAGESLPLVPREAPAEDPMIRRTLRMRIYTPSDAL